MPRMGFEHTIPVFSVYAYFFLSSCSHFGAFPSFISSFTDGRTPWTGDQLVARPLPKHRTRQTKINAYTHQISMPCVGFWASEEISCLRPLGYRGRHKRIRDFKTRTSVKTSILINYMTNISAFMLWLLSVQKKKAETWCHSLWDLRNHSPTGTGRLGYQLPLFYFQRRSVGNSVPRQVKAFSHTWGNLKPGIYSCILGLLSNTFMWSNRLVNKWKGNNMERNCCGLI
jgi:hypothetical protein